MKQSHLHNVVMGGIDLTDHPHYTTAFIKSADTMRGGKLTALSEQELKWLNQDVNLVYQEAIKWIL